MKTKINFVSVTVIASMIALAPIQSQAVVAIFNPGVLLAGLASFVIGGTLDTIGSFSCIDSECPAIDNAMSAIGGLGVFAGLIMLDAHQDVAFTSITADQGLKMGLTAEELDAYNSPDQLDAINLVREQVQAGTQGINDPVKAIGISHDLWEKFGSKDLTPAAFSALKKIAASAYKKD